MSSYSVFCGGKLQGDCIDSGLVTERTIGAHPFISAGVYAALAAGASYPPHHVRRLLATRHLPLHFIASLRGVFLEPWRSTGQLLFSADEAASDPLVGLRTSV